MEIPFRHITLIGLGLIGASIAHKLRQIKFNGTIEGFAPSAKTRARAAELGLVDRIAPTLTESVAHADLVIFCSPPGTFGQLAKTLRASLAPHTLLSDVGSFKCRAIEDITPHLPEGTLFVPAHPIAGTEHSGIDAGFAELFESRWTILTPLENTSPAYKEATEKLKTFWLALGAKVSSMTPEHHDRVLALTSHLPHLIAWTMVASALGHKKIDKQEVIAYSGGGFKDFTRLASSDPIMWRDVMLGNRASVLEMIETFTTELEKLRQAIDQQEGDFLQNLFTQTRHLRDEILTAEKKPN